MGTYAKTVFEEKKNNEWVKLELDEMEENKRPTVLRQDYDSFVVLSGVRNRHEIREKLFEVRGCPKDLSE